MQLYSTADDMNGNWQTADTCRQATECETVGHTILFCETFEKPDIIKKADSSGHQQATYRYNRKTMNTEWPIHPYIFRMFQFTWIYTHAPSKSHAEPWIHLGISLASISSCSAFKKKINYWSDFLHSSDTGEKVGVQWDSTSTIHRLQESLRFSEEGSFVKYSHRVWGTHEASQVD
jgi:hypothetical protein